MDDFIRNIDFYEYNVTVLSPLALLLTLAMCVLIFRAKKGSAVVPVFIVASYITQIQRIVISGLDFDMLRIVVLVSLARIFLKGEMRQFKFNNFDRLVFFFVLSMLIMHTVQLQTSGAFLNKLGFSLDYFGAYLVFRVFLEKMEDARYFLLAMSLIVLPVTLSMVSEQLTGKNLFSYFGGVPENTMLRSGRLRSQGAFSHPILAGTFGATMFPLFYAQWKTTTKHKKLFLLGAIAAVIITLTSSSSGPLLSFAASLFGLFLWRFREKMPYLKWGAITVLLLLHLIMKAPVWALMWRVAVVAGSTGYHRFALLDQFFKHFSEWWFAGTSSMGYWGWGLQDVTNQYVLVGVEGGLLPLVIFIVIIWKSFNKLGETIREREIEGDRVNAYFLWALGTSLFSHVVSFMGVSYFGQMMTFWIATLALVGSLTLMTAFKTSTRHQEGEA